MERRYARLRRAPLDDFPGAAEVPDSGMCLSVFVVLEPPGAPGAVLLGRLDPTAPWWELGGIDPGRIARIGERWMLPSRQLLLFESPADAARGILNDQLGIASLPLDGPLVFSDPSDAPPSGHRDPHWDLHFVFRGRTASDEPPRHRAWRELRFVDVTRTPRSDIARGQGDVLELVGRRPLDAPAPAGGGGKAPSTGSARTRRP